MSVEVFMAITDGYASLAEVKAAARISDSVDDAMLEIAIEAASREIDGYAERVFTSNAGTRLYIPMDSYLTQIDDLVSITSLETSSDGDGFDTTWSATDYQLEPLNSVSGGLTTPATRIRAVGDYLFPQWDLRDTNAQEATVRVVGTFGWSAIPAAIKQATILLSMRQFKRYDAPLGIAGFGDLGGMRVSRLDPDVEALVSPFKKVRMA
jgi:hypothetical protein|tara:strand:+ start:474 stop:1100 length:627 start_codon:yes stop_codon:yes gene_type:complete